MEYPTRNGISIPTHELELPESKLDLRRPESFNTHHREWSRRSMGRFSITRTLRDLTRLQDILPKDVHQELHRLYTPPELPTIRQAMAEVMDAYDNDETVRVYLIEERRYVEYPINVKPLLEEYNGNI